jgi:hypothetical protein
MRAVPDRNELRALYDAAVVEIGQSRPGINLTAGFYAETGDSVFDAGYLALSDHSQGLRRLHVVSAPSGGGKTTYSFAFIAALIRYVERTLCAPFGCIFVADQITRCDAAYGELNALMPGKVAIWTSEHDPRCEDRTRVKNPAATFTKGELARHPVIVTTHHFYNGAQGHKAQMWAPDGDDFGLKRRALAIIDERPEEVEIHETTLRQAHAVRDAMAQKAPEISGSIDALLFLMALYDHSGRNRIVKPENNKSAVDLLCWFAGDEAVQLAKTYAPSIPGLGRLFGFARSMTLGCSFSASEGSAAIFIGWQAKLMVRPGTMLLDATADIDGISQICPWREHVKTAQANYKNLDVIHVPQHAKRNLREHFKKVGNRQRYAEWMVETIKAHMTPGERGLVICKKALFDNQQIPNWGAGDPRFENTASYTERYEWDIGGRKLCATHWGTGVGANLWRDADVVFLFDEFFLPKRIAIATVQALRGHGANEGDLASMTTLRSKAGAVELISEGHRLRWTKQLALRGRGRRYDDAGVCGKQRLVVASDARSFLANVHRLFPGALVAMQGGAATRTGKVTNVDALIRILSNPELPLKLSATDIGKLLGRSWGSVAGNLMTPAVVRSLESIGWRYVSRRGRGGSHFERILPPVQLDEAA